MLVLSPYLSSKLGDSTSNISAERWGRVDKRERQLIIHTFPTVRPFAGEKYLHCKSPALTGSVLEVLKKLRSFFISVNGETLPPSRIKTLKSRILRNTYQVGRKFAHETEKLNQQNSIQRKKTKNTYSIEMNENRTYTKLSHN